MKKLRELLHITEEVNPTKWILSWKRPDFQVETEYESNEISADEAKNLLLFLSSLDTTDRVEPDTNDPSQFPADGNDMLDYK